MLCARSSVNNIVDSLKFHSATVFWVKKMMKEGKLIKCAKPTGRKCASRMEDATKAIIKSLKEELTKSMRSFAKEHFLVPATVSKIERGQVKVQGHYKKNLCCQKRLGLSD